MAESDYQSHASRMSAAAKITHTKWVASLNSEQRQNLRKLGVLDPSDDNHEVGGHAPTQTSDISDSPLARIDPDFAEALDGQAGPLADRFNVPLSVAKEILAWHLESTEASLRTHEADMLGIVVGGLLATNNVQIAAAGLAFACDMAAANNLGTPANYARRLGVSRTILSKSVKAWKRDLNLRTNHHQKSDEACKTYSAVAKEKHWRKKKTSARELFMRLNHLRKK